jgi:hypothetical protein
MGVLIFRVIPVDTRLAELFVSVFGSVIRPNQREIYFSGKTTDED